MHYTHTLAGDSRQAARVGSNAPQPFCTSSLISASRTRNRWSRNWRDAKLSNGSRSRVFRNHVWVSFGVLLVRAGTELVRGASRLASQHSTIARACCGWLNAMWRCWGFLSVLMAAYHLGLLGVADHKLPRIAPRRAGDGRLPSRYQLVYRNVLSCVSAARSVLHVHQSRTQN